MACACAIDVPEQLKAAVEEAAAREGCSVNAWLVRAASAAVARSDRLLGQLDDAAIDIEQRGSTA